VSKKALSLVLLAVVQLAQPVPAVPATEPESATWVRIDPAEIVLDMFYGGTTVHVKGGVPAGYDVAVDCVGKKDTVELKKKGKVFGILWMNVGDVDFRNVPSIYLLSTSGKLDTLAPPTTLEQLGVGYRALESGSCDSLQSEEKHRLFRELLKLKESEKLYAFNEAGVQLEPGENETVHLSARFFLPPKAPAGEYEVRLFGFKEGQGRLLRTERLRLRRVGVTAFIFSLAQRYGLLYGVLAVVVALVVGLLTGFVFGLGSKNGH